MPIINRRPHIIQLLNKAVQQNDKIMEINRQFLNRPASLWFMSTDFEPTDTVQVRRKALLYNTFITFSRSCERLHNHHLFTLIRRLCWPIAFSVMAYEAPKFGVNNSSSETVFYVLDVIINVFFLLDSLSRLFGLLLKVQIERVCKREMTIRSILLRSGAFDIIVTVLCFAYGFTEVGLWFRLVRLVLITASALEMFPQMNVLMSGISSGLKSIFFTIVVFVLVLLFYAAVGHHLYYDRDPLHFGSFVQSFFTFWQLATFDNWTSVYYTVAHGCANYPGDYSSLSFAKPVIDTAFGSFREPFCDDSKGRPIASSVVFITFAFIEGYILVSLNLAAVAIGINERLAELRDLSEYGDLDEDEEQPFKFSGSNRPTGGNLDSKAAKLLGNKTGKESREITAVLAKVWEIPQNGNGDMADIFKVQNFASLSMDIKLISLSGWIEPVHCLLVFIDAILQFVDEEAVGFSFDDLLWAHWFFQACYIIDIALRCISYSDNPNEFYKDNWSVFAVLMTALNFVPLCQPNSELVWYHVFASFRILRLVAILKVFRFMPDLACILNAIDMSYLCLIYCGALMALFLSYFALAGVLLFKSAIPYFFGNLGVSMWSLVQCMTQDNWSVLMRMAQYGCENFGFNTGVEGFDKSCIVSGLRGRGVGYWSPIFFIIFIVVASMVLVSLLVGVIITSLELDREDLLDEEEVKAKLKVVQRRYHLQPAQITMLLHLFEKCDLNSDGALTYEEIVVILDSLKMEPSEQFQFFLRVDTDKSGQIDFAEFCEMIALVGLGRKANAAKPPPLPTHPEASSSSKTSAMIVKGIGHMREAIEKAANELLNDTKQDEEVLTARRAKMRSAKIAPALTSARGPLSHTSSGKSLSSIPMKSGRGRREDDEIAEVKGDDHPIKHAYLPSASDLMLPNEFDVHQFNESDGPNNSQKSVSRSETSIHHSSIHRGGLTRPHHLRNDVRHTKHSVHAFHMISDEDRDPFVAENV